MASEYLENYLEKKKQEQEDQQNQPSAGGNSSYLDVWKSTWVHRNGERVGNDLANRVNAWIAKVNGFGDSFTSRQKQYGESYQGDASAYLQNVMDQRYSLITEEKEIRDLLKKYSGVFDAEWLKKLDDALNSGSTVHANVLRAAESNNAYWQQFSSQNDYDWYRKYSPMSMEELYSALGGLEVGSEEYNYVHGRASYNDGWLKEDGVTTVENSAARQARYKHNTDTVAKLTAEYDALYEERKKIEYQMNFGTPEHAARVNEVESRMKQIKAQIDALSAENNRYSHGQGKVDPYFGLTQNDDFAAAPRVYDNITREELDRWDDIHNGTPRTNGDGKLVDISGNVIDDNWIGYQQPVIEDKLGMFLATDQDTRLQAYDEAYEGTWATVIRDGVYRDWDKLTKDEIGIYYYLLAHEGRDSAYQFLDSMTSELNRRTTAEMAERIQNANGWEKLAWNIASVPANVLGGGMAFIDDTINTIKGEEINPYSKWHSAQNAGQTVRSATAEDINRLTNDGEFLGITLGDAYQSIMSGVDSLAGAMTFGSGYTVLMGMGAASAEAKELYERGASKEQIAWGGVLAGAAELVFEKVSIDHFFDNILAGGTKSGAQLIRNLLIQGGVEASEEMLTEIANTITDAMVMGSRSEFEQSIQEYMEQGYTRAEASSLAVQKVGKNVWKSGIGGLISGGFMGGGASAAKYGSYKAEVKDTGRTIMSADGGVDALKNLANQVAGVSEDTKVNGKLTKQLSKVDKKATARNVGNLYNTVQNANDLANADANQADIAKSLQRKGFGADTANDIAGALVARYNGQELTRHQEKLLKAVEGNEVVSKAVSDIMANEKSTMGQRSQNIRDFQSDIALGTAINTMAKQHTEKAFTPEGKYAVSPKGEATAMVTEEVDGKTVTKDSGEVIDIKGIKEIHNGRMLLDIGDGKTIDAKNVAYANQGEALVYEAIANLGDNIDADTANKLMAKFDGGNAMVFARGIAQAYTYGFYGLDRAEMRGKHTLSAELTEAQRNEAYALGEEYRPVKDAKDKATAKATKASGEKGVYYRDKDGKTTDIRTHLDNTKIGLKDVQKTAIEVMEKMSQMMGIRFNVFESWVENGKRYYLDENGVKTEGNPNGFYDTRTGEIYIDLNAGNDYQGTMLFTIAHELTHFMRQWSPEHFTNIAKIVFQHGGMKGDVSKLVALKQAKAKSRGKPISYDTAMEEVVADGMETILKDGKVLEFMEDVKKKDHAAWEKIKEWFQNFAAFLREMVSAYSGQSAQTVEGAKVAEFSSQLLNQIEQIWAEGAVAAGESYQAAKENVTDAKAEKNTTEDGGVKYSFMGYDQQTGKGVYSGNFPKGTPKAAKTERILQLIQNVWSKKPIRLVVSNGESSRTIYAKFDPYVDPSQNTPTDASKIAGGNRHGNHTEQRVTLDLGEDYYQIASEATYNYSKVETGKSLETHNDVIMWHYFVNDILFAEYGQTDLVPYYVTINVKEKADGDYVYSFNAEKEPSTQRTLHAAVNTYKGANGELFLDDIVSNPKEVVNSESVEAMDVEIDEKTESVAPAVLKSERTWTASDYVQARDEAAKDIAKAIGVTEKKAKDYIDSINSIAKMIAEDRVRLDYFSSPGRSSFVGNVEYGGSFDFSTLCKKRRLLTGTFTAIQKALPNTALTANEILDIRNRMKDAGLEVSCGLCYVEGSRANMGQFAKEFLKLYKQYYPDAWQPNMADVNTPDGIEWVRINHPECYEQYEYFWNHYGTLKPGDKNLFASQQKPKLYQLHTEYKGEILEKFNDDDNVEEKNLNGGIRLQSFSDFEIVHLIDTMQIIMDMSRVGLAGQAYTKVPDFAWALGDTGLKINLSLIAKGVDANGKLIFDDVEGMPIAEAMKLRDRYSKNVGTILVAFNDEQLMAAMADDRVDFIIPFHRSQWKKNQYEAMGLPAKTKDYTYMQNEKFIKPQYHEYRGRMVRDKATNYMPNEYWDFAKSGKENAESYLEMCARNNKRPKFYKLLQNNGDGSYSLKADGSTDGYWKLLIDFKMYDNEGNGSPQMPVKPEFNMDEAIRMLNDYRGGHSNFPVAQGVVDEFVRAYKDSHKGAKFSDRDTDSVSNRALLANALEGLVKDETERTKIQEYKGKIDLVNAEERKLRDLNEQIKELSFAKGPRDTAKIRQLRDEATKTANRISIYDKQLLRLEASAPLQKVLEREKKKAYQRAEKKGKEALAEYKAEAEAKQKETAEKWRESRRVAVEGRQKTALRHKVQSVVGELNQLLLNEDKKRHVPDSLKKAVADALSLVNMDTVGAEERAAKYAALIAKETDPDKIDAYTVTMENILRQGEKMGQRLKELRDAYEEIQNSDDPDIANAYDPVIAGSLQELAGTIGNTALKDMSIEQLSDVYDMYKMVLTKVRDANKSLIDSIKEGIAERASRVVDEVRRFGGEQKLRASVLDPVRTFFWNNLKPVYAMEHIGSAAMTEAYNNVRAGEDTWVRDVTEARAYYIDKSKKYGYDSWDLEKKHTFASVSGLEFELSLEQILSLYAYSKRDQAYDHLRLGGFVFDSNIETYKDEGSKILKYKVNTADAHQITPDILADIVGTLSDEQKRFVDEMQDYLSTVMGAKGNEVTMKMYGVKLFKEKFYFPLKSAKQFMFEQNEVSGEVRIKNSGFTNKVVAKANNPVILSNFMDVWANHINDMSMYHSFVLPLEDFNRIFNYNSPKAEGKAPVSVKGTIQNAYSPAAVSYVKQLITDLNGGAMADPRETFAKAMTAKFKKAKVFSSLSVVVQQPSAIGRAFALVDPKYFQPTKDGMNHKELWTEVKQYAPVAVIKEMGYFDTNMGKSTLDFIKAKEYDGFKEKAKALFTDSGYRDEILSKAPALADELTWCAIWNAVKRETAAQHKGLMPGSEEFLKAAGERFTEVVTKTQVYDSVLARSANMRSKSGMMSMITSFMAEPTTSINMLEDAVHKAKMGYKGYAARAFASVAVSIILNNALVALVYGARDDDEDETYWEKYMQAFVSGMLDDINPITYYPFLKDMWSVLQGYDVERSDMSLVSDLADGLKGLVKAYTDEDGDVEGAWWNIAGSVANIGGIPMQNIRRDINAVINAFNTIAKDASGRATTLGSMGDALEDSVRDSLPVVGWFPGETKADKLYDAIISGDTAYVDRLKGSYKTETAYHSAVRKALRENDPRIMEAAVASYDGDPSERVRIAKLIVADGFSQDDVVAAINAEINAMTPASGSSGAKAKGYYTAEDFATEIANGDQASAYAVKVDVIQTLQKNGKTKEAAEKSFTSSAKDALKDLYLAGEISGDKVVNALVVYCGAERDDAAGDLKYWDFKKAHPDVYADDAWIDEYYKEVETSGVSLKMFVDYRNEVKGITGDGKKERRMAVIHSMPITSAQKDALYLAEGWAESKLYEAPWH